MTRTRGATVIERTLTDYYRCPDEFLKMSLAGEPSGEPGYFRFGEHICYGQTSGGLPSRSPSDELDDTLPGVTTNAGVLRVPFDPSAIVDNLRLERYAAHTQRPGRQALASWQRWYYALRGVLPRPLRRRLQRTYFRDWSSLAFPRWPVDVTVDLLLERLLLLNMRSQGVSRVPFVWFWPDGARSCAIVTHDVETSVGRDRCSWLMDLDDEYEIKSSFEIVPEGRYDVSPELLDEIDGRDFEINVHDLNHDGYLFSSRKEFLRRAPRINEHLRALGARGFRSGSLFRQPAWYEALDIAYDMSIPNVGHLEVQRGGCCTVMPYFIDNIVELPVTTTQDYSLFHILGDFSNDVWKTQIESVLTHHGLLSFIVHPDYLGVDRARQAYRGLLDRLARLREARECWVTLPADVERWWRERHRTRLVRDGSRWRIEGPGRERARIAYAELDGDELVYTIEPASPVGHGVRA